MEGNRPSSPLKASSQPPTCSTPQAPRNLEEPSRGVWLEEDGEGEKSSCFISLLFYLGVGGVGGGQGPWDLRCGFLQIFMKYGRQRWKLKGKIEANGKQSWDGEEVVFLPLIVGFISIKVQYCLCCPRLPTARLGSPRVGICVHDFCPLLPTPTSQTPKEACTPSPWRRPLLSRREGCEEHRGSVPGLSPGLPVRPSHASSHQVTELKGLATHLLVGSVTCETKELFAARPQVVAVDINDLGTIKLSLEITW